jgi:hypothetical protein
MGRLKKVLPRSARVGTKFEEKLASVQSNQDPARSKAHVPAPIRYTERLALAPESLTFWRPILRNLGSGPANSSRGVEIFGLVTWQLWKNIESLPVCSGLLLQETSESERSLTGGAGRCVALSDVVEFCPGPEGTFLRRPMSLEARGAPAGRVSVGFQRGFSKEREEKREQKDSLSMARVTKFLKN